MQKKWQFLVLALGFLFSVQGAVAAESVYQTDIKTLEAQLFPESDQGLAFTTIALPLEGFLVQAIPQRNAKLFVDGDVLKATQNKSHDLYFTINPYVRKFLKYLTDNKYEIKTYTTLSDEVAKQLMAGVTFAGKQSLDKFATSVKVDLSKGLTEAQFGKNVLFVTYGDTKSPAAQTIATGPVYYVFPTFAQMTENKVTDPAHAPYFTDKESAWAIERNKAARVYTYLFEANRIDEKNFATVKAELAKEPQQEVIRRGLKRIAGAYRRLEYRWVTDPKAKRVTGCEIADTRKDLNIKDADVAACEDVLKVALEFKVDKKEARVQSCEIRTLDKRNLLRQAGSLDECIKEDSDQIRYAVDFNSKKCSVFTKNGNFIAEGGKAGCEKEFVLFVPEKPKWFFFRPFDGIEKLSRKQLIARVISPPPSSDDPFRLYDPFEDGFHGGLPLSVCYDPRIKQTFKLGANGQLLKECELDTLYSWGTQEKIDALMKVMGRGPWVPMQTVFNTRGPMTTFGYGPFPIRVKLIKDVKFKVGQGRCDRKDTEEVRTTVYYRNDGHFSDWTICHPAVIHSWSHDTKEHYDEIVKDFWRYQEVKKQGQPILGTIEVYSPAYHQGNDIFFGGSIDDRTPYTFDNFKAAMVGLQKRISKETEEVLFNPSLSESEKKWVRHFETDRPVYWNDK